MEKKWISFCFVGVALLMSLSLSVGVLFAGPSPAGANEVLAKAPALTGADGRPNPDLLSESASWFSDHFFLRQELISANNALFARVFGVSDADDVILGRDGWLYYGPTLDDYTGLSPMTERELCSAARNLFLMQEYCQGQGRAFLFVIAPNKNSLYPQHMPDYGVRAEETNAQRLMERLAQTGVSHLDLFALFGAQEETLYFAHDSHWNAKGAALAADAVNAAFGVKTDYFEGDFSALEPHGGDLYEMLYPAYTDDEIAPVYGGALAFEYGVGGKQPDSITINTVSQRPGSLLAYRDSFGNLLYPYLAGSFGQARFSRSTGYDLTLEGQNVLIELVERNLRYLIENTPVLPAPARQVTLPEAGPLQAACTVEPQGELSLVRGTLPVTPDADSPVYVLWNGTVYEAFCLENNGFAARLPGAQGLQGVAAQVDGTVTAFAVCE